VDTSAFWLRDSGFLEFPHSDTSHTVSVFPWFSFSFALFFAFLHADESLCSPLHYRFKTVAVAASLGFYDLVIFPITNVPPFFYFHVSCLLSLYTRFLLYALKLMSSTEPRRFRPSPKPVLPFPPSIRSSLLPLTRTYAVCQPSLVHRSASILAVGTFHFPPNQLHQLLICSLLFHLSPPVFAFPLFFPMPSCGPGPFTGASSHSLRYGVIRSTRVPAIRKKWNISIFLSFFS